MDARQRAMSAYGQAAETQAPIRQIVLLYDGALRRIKEARQAIEERRINDRFVAVSKATAIVEGLQSGLDHEHGGEIATNLDRIYSYVCFRLQDINLKDDVAICDELASRLGELREAWAQLASGGAERADAGSAAARVEASVSSAAPDAGLAVTI